MKAAAALVACSQSVLLAACAVPPQDSSKTASTASTPSTPVASAPAALRPGVGIVESASIVALGSSPSVGGTASAPTMAYRLKMDDGSTQSVVQAGERYEVGDRLEITQDGRLSRR
jgi:hypothetical protein